MKFHFVKKKDKIHTHNLSKMLATSHLQPMSRSKCLPSQQKMKIETSNKKDKSAVVILHTAS